MIDILEHCIEQPKYVEYYIDDMVDVKISFNKNWCECITGFMPAIFNYILI